MGRNKLQAIVGMLTGGMFGVLTFVLLDLINTASNRAIYGILHSFIFLLYPGLFVATATGGGLFSTPLWAIAISNAGIYFVVGWLLTALWDRHFRQ
jgi:membrane-bound metal-dependent hydrolase YbcI (DUF457 family)